MLYAHSISVTVQQLSYTCSLRFSCTHKYIWRSFWKDNKEKLLWLYSSSNSIKKFFITVNVIVRLFIISLLFEIYRILYYEKKTWSHATSKPIQRYVPTIKILLVSQVGKGSCVSCSNVSKSWNKDIKIFANSSDVKVFPSWNQDIKISYFIRFVGRTMYSPFSSNSHWLPLYSS